jgi:hypothetical protein
MKNFNRYKLLVISGSLIASQAMFSAPAQAFTLPSFLTNLFKPTATTTVEGWKKQCEAKKNCTNEKVPEPMTILGVGAALASLPAFKKHYNKANKEEIS